MMWLTGIERAACRGMTLVESLLAVAMLGVGLIIIVGALLNCLDAAAVCAQRLCSSDVLSRAVAEAQLSFEQQVSAGGAAAQTGSRQMVNRVFFWQVQPDRYDELSGVAAVQCSVQWQHSRRRFQIGRPVSLLRQTAFPEAR
ncbi:MAG: prepilin-type N-terminal cleavage/methylation domain-containing protein [Candidatus Omnitrophica bacterium]|nr:prepilin-type N-terminal cleavage/methylation domain-containing protein [Candidatus Omnitrophota bacterium]